MSVLPIKAARFIRASSRLLVALQVLALAFLVPLSSASAAPANSASAAAGQRLTVAPTTVSFAHPGPSIAAAKVGSAPARVPFHSRTGTASSTTANQRAGSAATSNPLATTGSVSVTTGFATITVDQQTNQFGNDQYFEPPDPYVAAGSNVVVQTNNSVMSVWTKTGTLVSEVDLNVLAKVPTGFGLFDPRITYDATSNRWFLSAMALNNSNNGAVVLLVSQTSDPNGLWNEYVFAPNASGISYDQPKLGINDDKVVISWDDYSSLAFDSFVGSRVLVLQKSDLIAGTSVAGLLTPQDATRFSIVPAQSLSSTTTEYLVYNNNRNQKSPSVGVIAVTGTPRNNNVTFGETDLAATPTVSPPPATQPGGAPAIETNDDRFLNAVWQNGILWTGGNSGCTPSGDTSVRACLRLVEVSTGAPAVAKTPVPALLQSVDYGFAGFDLFYPAVGVDTSNNLVVVFSASSSTLNPSIAAFGAHNDTKISSADVPVLLAKGANPYVTYPNVTQRWGDYSGAAMDPADPTKVWVAGEYSAAPTGNWGTALAELSVP